MSRYTLAGFTALAITSVAASAATVAVPNANAATLGNGQSNNPLGNERASGGGRYQQVYDAGQFSSFGASESINQIAFRAKQPLFGAFINNSVTVSNVQIQLSTTSKSAAFNDANYISNQFANNIGADVKTVYSGSLTLTTPTSGTSLFGYVINLQTPFTYSKASGNLLLDFIIPDNASVTDNGTIGYAQLDTVTDNLATSDGVASAFGATGSGTIGANSTTGLVTQFMTVVPEPTSLAAMATGLIAAARRRRAK